MDESPPNLKEKVLHVLLLLIVAFAVGFGVFGIGTILGGGVLPFDQRTAEPNAPADTAEGPSSISAEVEVV